MFILWLLQYPVAKFIVPDWGDKVKLWYRVVVPTRQATWAGGGYDNPMPESTIVYIYPPVRDYEFGYRN